MAIQVTFLLIRWIPWPVVVVAAVVAARVDWLVEQNL